MEKRLLNIKQLVEYSNISLKNMEIVNNLNGQRKKNGKETV